ncbi:MAG: 2-oxoacid:acceptor oxidoreductase family protein [Deltaproteobacteria bacterium]|nr:2-oxoacid:acceptor oxidoreductase family protein [Deltaproteobacteria bacterium]
MYHDVIMAGFGGQGILMIGNLLAVAGLQQGLRVTFFPSYGVEMRGGTANCTVTLSDREIGSPVTARPLGVIAMNEPSVVKFAPRIREGGHLLVNSSLAQKDSVPTNGPETLWLPCNELALELGDGRLASMIALGAYVRRTGVVSQASLESALAEVLPAKAHKLIPLNAKALRKGWELAEKGG